MKKIVLSHALYKPGMDALQGKAEVLIPNNGNSDEIINELKDAEGFILRIGKIDRKAIEACPKLKVITRPGVGVDNVDVAAATENGIPVVICPSANFRAVAEHALALIFSLSKSIVNYDNETRKGNFAIRNKYTAVELEGKTVSVLGFGNIGKELAKMCKSIGMNICIYDPYVSEEVVVSMGYEYSKDMKEAVSKGDFVSLHMPSLPSTRGMIKKEHFEAMKDTAFFINCARGDIVNENDLYKALNNNIIAGAGLDVLVDEPMKADNPIMKLDNVIITPHSAAQTQETTGKTVIMAVEGTLAVINGEKWANVCNPEVYEHPKWKDR
ncbi:D-3-phosphoglycerate dehydrogenase [Clostridium homopropionicum DSM 5847]|uniref:D-3-phosphoglycerate dehydrogenase n=1 Tax=Clostridium homopropionicum DSM 5847 TaxID=1121318 RepID=A0A0L6Z6K6_9CLOT|nr:hydroxyacid dehydrogenase [Clostridium homopropionicum]KOA18448.1 D-3-phosphoglycerate dehydrogenase [Clostridium homopropionicum DSM 5847]SFF66621.1 D-3-phosphoglycerate dehydrogenase [Clostridium homopropionicum]